MNITQKELKQKIAVLGKIDKEMRNRVVCSLIGHSNIQTMFFGYVYCARCTDQIGDTLASTFDASTSVIVGHNCDKCQENYKALTWRDKLYAPDPFKEAT